MIQPDNHPRPSALPLAGWSTVYLLIPAVIFAWGWLRTPYALAVTLVAAVVFFFAIRDARGERDRTPLLAKLRPLWPALVIVVAWMLLSGIGGFGLQNGDYKSNNAMFKGLIDSPWPLEIEFSGRPVRVIYYFAYFLPAALVGKLFGWEAANVFIFFWALAGVLLAFAWFRRVSATPNKLWPMLLLALFFCLASGMDSIGYYLFQGNPFRWGKHVENWAGLFQLSSQTSLLYWVPQQAPAAWILAGLTYTCVEDARLFRYLGMAVAAAILWTPFGVVGIAPYLLAAVIALFMRKQTRVMFAPLSLGLNVASLGIAAVHLLFISSNEYSFPIGLLWNLAGSHEQYLVTSITFWCLEFGLLAAAAIALGVLVGRARRRAGETLARSGLRWAWFGLACLAVSILLLFKMGYVNDLVMRGAIPSLFYFWAFVFLGLREAVPFLKQRRVKIVHALAVLLLLIGSATSLAEIIRSAGQYHFGPPNPDDVKPIATATYPHIVRQRIGRNDAPFLRLIGR